MLNRPFSVYCSNAVLHMTKMYYYNKQEASNNYWHVLKYSC